MAATSQATLNQQPLFEEDDQQQIMPSQMGFFSFPNSHYLMTYPQLATTCHQSSLRSFIIPDHDPDHAPPSTTLPQNLLLSSASQKQKEGDNTTTATSCLGGVPHLLSLQRSSTANLWACGEVKDCLSSRRMGSGDDHLGVVSTCAVKMMKKKKMMIKARRKVREPRFSFKTMSDVDVLDDGYKWRKYGQKVVKNTQHPRSYYRCTQDNCGVKKRVERLAEDPRMVITTYEGRHAHSPSHDDHDDHVRFQHQTPSHLNNFFY